MEAIQSGTNLTLDRKEKFLLFCKFFILKLIDSASLAVANSLIGLLNAADYLSNRFAKKPFSTFAIGIVSYGLTYSGYLFLKHYEKLILK